MPKTIDRISGFLSNPQTRLKYYNDQQVETILKKDVNLFAEKTKFKGRVIGVPRVDENASFNPFETSSKSYVEEMVFVRLDDIDEYFLPDPAYAGLDGDAIVSLILSHPLAVVDGMVQQNSLKLGEKVMCEFTQNPGNQGRQRGLRVIKILDSPDAEDWRKAISAKLLSNGLGELASAFASGNVQPIGAGAGNPMVADFVGNYGAASAQVKVFLDDLVKRIRAANKFYLLPLNVGSLFRSLRDQATVMYENVAAVPPKNELKEEWFKTTYKPDSSIDITTLGTSSNDKKKIMRYAQSIVLGYLLQAQKNELTKEQTITLITDVYKKYKDEYNVLPSSHNIDSAVDIRTSDWRREKNGVPPYTDDQLDELLELAQAKKYSPKGSAYSTWAQIETRGGTGEHLHVNVDMKATKEE